MEFFVKALCLLLAVSITSTLRVRPIDNDSPIIILIGTTRDVTSSSCKFIHEPNATYNVSVGSTVQFTVITVNCTAIFLNVSGTIIPAKSPSFSQFDPEIINNQTADYIEGLYTISDITLQNDGDTIQFFANGLNGGDFAYSTLARLRVQGPPGPVTDLSCRFLTQDQLHITFNEPADTLLGVKTSFNIEPHDLSEAFTTDNSKVNVTVSNITFLDMYKAYNITITSFNTGSMGTALNCTVFIPNATQISASIISVIIVNNGNDAIVNLMTVLLNTKDKPLCPGCYPDTVHMFINFSNGHIKEYEFSVPPGETTFHERNISVQKNALLSGDIYYCNVAECVKSGIGLLSTFDLQVVQLKSADNGSVCLTCTFTNGSLADGCIVKLRVDTDEYFELITSAKSDGLITNECYTVNALTDNESYHWEAYAFSWSNGSPFKLSSRPALTGTLTIPNKTSPSTELPATSASPSTESPTSGPNHYTVPIFIGLAIFIIVCVLLAVSLLCFFCIKKKFPMQSCSRFHMQLVPEFLSGESHCQPSYQPGAPLHTIREDDINEGEGEMLPGNEQETAIENANITISAISSSTGQHTYKTRKRPASISLPRFTINNEVPLSPHAASQPTTPNVLTPNLFSFPPPPPPPGPTRNSSHPQLPFSPS